MLEGLPHEAQERERRPEAYFSVPHLLQGVRVVHEDGTVTRHTIASRGKDLPDGRAKFQALGGGAKLTKDAILDLKSVFGDALRFRAGEESDDARFYIELPEDACGDVSESDSVAVQKYVDRFAQNILDKFTEFDSTVIEDSITRELEHDLKEAVPDITDEELREVHSEHVGVVSPIRWQEVTSGRSSGVNNYYRIFHLFDITLPEAVFKK